MELWSLLGGAGITALAGLIGAWFQHKREHRRWVRERRFETYVKMLNYLNGIKDLSDEELKVIMELNHWERSEPPLAVATDSSERHPRWFEAGFKEVQGEINILGPERVDTYAAAYVAVLTGTDEERHVAHQRLLNSMRDELKVEY